MQARTDQRPLFGEIQMAQLRLYLLAAGGDQRGQLTPASAIVGQAQAYPLLGQGQQAVAAALKGALQASMLGQFHRQLRGMLAPQCLALGLKGQQLGTLGGNPRVLPATGKYRQIDAQLQREHVAEGTVALLIGQLPTPVGTLVSFSQTHPCLGLTGLRGEGL